MVAVDPGLLERAVANIVENAIVLADTSTGSFSGSPAGSPKRSAASTGRGRWCLVIRGSVGG